MKTVMTLTAAVLFAAGAAAASPIPAEGAYIPGPQNYGEKITLDAGQVYLEREMQGLGLSVSDKVMVTKAVSPAQVSERRGR